MADRFRPGRPFVTFQFDRNNQINTRFDTQRWLSLQPYIDPREFAAVWHILHPTPTTNRFLDINWPNPPTAMAFNRDRLGDASPQTMSTSAAISNKRTRTASPSRSTVAPAPKRQKLNAKKQKKNKGPATMAKPAVDEPVDYTDLKAWIAHQESLPEPVPLTDVQRRAIAALRDSLKTPDEPKSEIDIGDKDWVSLLHRYRDAHQQLGVSVEFHEDAGPNSQWMCHCTIKSSIQNKEGHPMDRRFPDLDLGFIPMGPDGGLRQPTFARKKDAKRYAAKCCVDFLMREKLMPLDGENVSFPKPKMPPPPPKKKKKTNPVSESTTNGTPAAKTPVGDILPSKNLSAHGNGVSTAPATEQRPRDETSQRHDAGESVEQGGGGAPLVVPDEDLSATERVLEMCNRLGICPPSYKFDKVDKVDPATGTTKTYFNGYADFGLDNVHVPDTVGRVVNCAGKPFAKEEVAEGVLGYLSKLEAQRKTAADELMSLLTSRELVSEP